MTTGPSPTRITRCMLLNWLWLGWAIPLRRPLVILLGFVGMAVVIILVLPWEVRGLKTQFGETYRQYEARVPRWLGRTPR